MMLRRLHLSGEVDWVRELELIGADPECWSRTRLRSDVLVFRVGPLEPPAASILKQSMLSASCDAIVCRGVITCSCETSDALLIGTARDLRRACLSMEHQPFGLDRLGEEIGQAVDRCTGATTDRPEPLIWGEGGRHSIDFCGGPAIMGILNVTPDSFSDGGLYMEASDAVDHALEMASAGAVIVDVGAESTRPGAKPVPAESQVARVTPVIRELRSRREDLIISIDTSLAEVAAAALEEGAEMINDVRALESGELRKLAASSSVPVVLMHMRGSPESMQDDPRYDDCLGEIYRFLSEAVDRAVESGVKRELVVIDPGIGFGKRLRDNLEILRRLRELRWLGRPVLLGHSRKSFLGHILGDVPASARDVYTHHVTAMVGDNADILRVHDVEGTVRALKVGRSLLGYGRGRGELDQG